ncbi:uncharacterized protein LOC144458614 [Epinephelus lanceolatus]
MATSLSGGCVCVWLELWLATWSWATDEAHLGFPRMLFLTEVPSSPPRCGKRSVRPWGPRSTSPPVIIEWANQDLEASLRCVASRLPASCSTHLPWFEYAHNSLVSYTTGCVWLEAWLATWSWAADRAHLSSIHSSNSP